MNAVNKDESLKAFLQPIGHLLDDDSVREIWINRPGEVFYEKDNLVVRESLTEATLPMLKGTARAAAKFNNKDIGERHPFLSATLPGGQRLHVVHPPACEAETLCFTIRKPSVSSRRLDQYVADGFFSRVSTTHAIDDVADELKTLHGAGQYDQFLIRAVQEGKTVVIAGETGSGKTEFMKALLQEIPRSERLITIEDVPELRITQHPNYVHLFYPADAKPDDPITAATLLKSCLRMKPDRILIGELRGAEAFDFLNVASSGHAGSITSLHAGSAQLAIDRLALMVLQNSYGQTLPYAVIRRLILSVVDVIVHVHKVPGIGRRITELWYKPVNAVGEVNP